MATKQNLYVDQGTSFLQTFTLRNPDGTPLDITNYTGRAQFRKEYTSTEAFSFTVSLGGNTGVVTLSLAPNTSSNVAAGRYVYDLELESNTGVVTRLLEGFITLTPEVTR